MATERTLIAYALFVAPGLRARVAFNDVPLLPTMMTGSFSGNGGINHRLVNGDNEVVVQLEPSTERARKDGLGDLDCKWFELTLARPAAAPTEENDHDVIYELALPDALQELPEERRRLPLTYVGHVDPGVSLHDVGYLQASPSQVPCEGNAELHAVVEELHRAFSNKERDRIADLCQLRVEDFALAFAGMSDATTGIQHQQLDELLADDPVFVPLEPEQLHFHPRAGGRVVHVTRTTGRAVLQGQGKVLRYTTDLLLAKTDHGWQVM